MSDKKIFEFKITKKYSALIALFVLLSLLTFVEIILIRIALKKSAETAIPLLMLTFYLIFVYRAFFWYLFGKENIEITQKDLTISKKGTFFVKSKTYDFSKTKNFRIENREFNFLDFFVSKTSTVDLKSYGCILFNFENEIINFGENLDSKTAGEILGMLKMKGI